MGNVNASTEFGMELAPRAFFGGGRYTLIRPLGRGELCEVWLAHDVPAAKRVALKFLPESIFSNFTTLHILTEQVRRNSLLLHTHIATTFEFVHDLRTAAIAMQYIDGWSLASMKLDRPHRRYQVEEIEWWVRQLCAALDYAHTEFDLVHGDIKPANLIQNNLDELKVIDFGLTSCLRTSEAPGGPGKKISGRLGFLSPHQVMGTKATKLDDVYSVGATIFDLLTGTPPFYKGDIRSQIIGHKASTMTERLRELGVKDVAMPVAWETAVAACLSKNPGDRPQSVVSVQQILDRFELGEAKQSVGS